MRCDESSERCLASILLSMSVQATLFESESKGRSPFDLRRVKDSSSDQWYVRGFDPTLPFSDTVVSLFSGAGGLDIGLENAGFETLACIELDKDCRATLRHNRPNWRLINGDETPGDVRGVSGTRTLRELGLERGELGLIVGGPPCQPFSNLGKRSGQYDPTNGDLFAHFVRMVEEFLPHGFIFENVEGFGHAKHSEVRTYLAENFARLGYATTSGVLNSADYGDPQVRKRFVMLGVRDSIAPTALPFPKRFENQAKASRFFSRFGVEDDSQPWFSVREALESLSCERLARNDNIVMGVSDLVRRRMQLVKQGENFKVLPKELLPNCWSSGKHQGQDTFGRLRNERPSVTIRTCAYNSAKGRYIHPTEDRGLNTAEMACLQSFPESWHFKCEGPRQKLVAIGKMIGNAVPVGLATALGEAMRSNLAISGSQF